MRVQTGGGDLVEHHEIVLRHLLGFLDACDVLAEPRQNGVDLFLLLLLRRPQRIVDRFTGHEGRHGAPHERGLGRALAQPRVGRAGEQYFSHHRHRGVASDEEKVSGARS